MAVNAESALEKLAATMPMVNNITTRVPIAPDAANIGSKSSGTDGKATPCFCASIISNTPKLKKSRLAGTKAKP